MHIHDIDVIQPTNLLRAHPTCIHVGTISLIDEESPEYTWILRLGCSWNKVVILCLPGLTD